MAQDYIWGVYVMDGRRDVGVDANRNGYGLSRPIYRQVI
jgi:hypothetical protein